MKLKKFLRVTKEMPEPLVFKKMILWSVILHLAVILSFGFKAFLFPAESLDLDAAIKVDIVDLPDKIKKLPAPAPTKPDAVNIQDTSKPDKPKQNSLDKIKKLAREEEKRRALEEIQKEVQEQEKASRQARARELLKGNAVSPGTALHGLTKAEFNEYLASIRNHVEPQWNLPEWLANDNLKAVVTVYIDNNGNVIRRFLKKSSGDARFDGYAMKAVDQSSPFPKPPPKFVDLVRVDGIEMGFPE